MNEKIKILSTKNLSDNVVRLLDQDKIDFFSNDYIQIKPIPFNFNALLNSSKNWVISSKNTLNILFKKLNLNQLNTIHFYCVGDKTAKIIKSKGLKLVASALSSKKLGEIIKQKYNRESFTLIGGVIKRDELKSLLKDLCINFTDISIYDTIFTPHLFKNELDGILFFSPSAIQSFTIKNTIKNEQLFCIGQTTAAEASKHSNNVHIAKNQTFESVIGLVNQNYA